jgi:hypothetical protein
VAEQTATWSPPQSENVHHQSISNYLLSILFNQSSDWLQASIDEILPAFRGKNHSSRLPAAS